jgi:hypothetical protein
MRNSYSSMINKILDADGGAYELLVVRGETPTRAHELLDEVRPEELVSGPVKSEPAARAMLAGLWLWHDGLEESHALSQKLNSAEGSYWHAILHRREGDFSNSKYWLAKCRGHPAGIQIAAGLRAIIGNSDPALQRLAKGGCDPGALVDLVERVHDRPSEALHSVAVAVQRLEWNCLFDYCAQVPGRGRV